MTKGVEITVKTFYRFEGTCTIFCDQGSQATNPNIPCELRLMEVVASTGGEVTWLGKGAFD